VACTPTVSSPLNPVWLTVILQRQIFSTARLDWSSVTEQRKQTVQPVSHRHNSTWLASVSRSKAVCRHLVIQLNRYAVVVTDNFICNVSVFSWYHFLWRNSSQSFRTSSLSRLQDQTQTHDNRHDVSGRVISPTQTYVSDKTQYSQETHPCRRRDSKLQSKQASGRRPTP